MAATVTFDKPTPAGRGFVFGEYERRGTINFGTYATGGISVTRQLFELPTRLDDLIVSPTAGYVAEFDKADGVVKLYVTGAAEHDALDQVQDTTDVSAVNFQYLARGR